MVTDNGRQQQKSDSTRIEINVIRVPAPSFFPNNQYTFEIDENEEIGLDLVDLDARKDDLKVYIENNRLVS